jgi:hypothetical protein
MPQVKVVDASTQNPIQNATVEAVVVGSNNNLTDATGVVNYVGVKEIMLTVMAEGYESYVNQPYGNISESTVIEIGLDAVQTPPTPPINPAATFDHPWTGNVENALRTILETGQTGQTVIDQMNAMGGIYAGGEFQPHHDQTGFPTYGFPWFYVSDLSNGVGIPSYQIIEFGTPPEGD